MTHMFGERCPHGYQDAYDCDRCTTPVHLDEPRIFPRVQIKTGGPFTAAIGVSLDRARFIETNMRQIIENQDGSITDVLNWLNGTELTDAEYIGAIFDLGYYNGAVEVASPLGPRGIAKRRAR